MEKLTGFSRLGDAMHEIQTGHLLMSDFGINAHHFWMIQGGDESQIVAGGGHVDIAARLVGFGFESEVEFVAARDVVFA